MIIAVTYENGQRFQHFGHTEKIRVYEINSGKVVSAQILDTNGHGHECGEHGGGPLFHD